MLCKALSDPDCHFPPLLLFVLADILCVSKLYSLSGKIVYLLFLLYMHNFLMNGTAIWCLLCYA